MYLTQGATLGGPDEVPAGYAIDAGTPRPEVSTRAWQVLRYYCT